MKSIKNYSLLVALLLTTTTLVQCQRSYEITEANVSRIIKTLSADDMRGRHTFSPDIEKAAAFIENEFSTIGLSPLDGLDSYRQTFNVYTIDWLQLKNLMVEVAFSKTTSLVCYQTLDIYEGGKYINQILSIVI